MCGCAKHGDKTKPCTCICPEHGNFQAAYDLAMERYDEILCLRALLEDAMDGVSLSKVGKATNISKTDLMNDDNDD